MRRKAIQRKIKSAIRGYSRVEELVRKATCSDPWGPSSTELLQIAQCASSFTDTEQIMRVLWKRLLAGGRNWLYVYKTLVVFEYLIKYGVDTVIEQCQSNRVYLATFLRCDSVQPNLSRRQVSLIRDRAQSILHLLSDSQHRMEEQERLHRTIGGFNDTPDLRYSSMRRSVSLDPVRGHTLYTARGAHSPQDVHPYREQHSPPSPESRNSRLHHSCGGFHATPQPTGTVQEDEELELQMRVAMALSLAESRKREHSNWQQFDADGSSSEMPQAQTVQTVNHVDALPLDPWDGNPNRNGQDRLKQQQQKLRSHSACPPSPSASIEGLGSGELHPRTDHLDGDPWAPLPGSAPDDITPCAKVADSNTIYDELALVDFTRTVNPVDGFGDSTVTRLTETPSITSTNPFLTDVTTTTGNGATVNPICESSPPTNPAEVAGFLGEYSNLVDLENLMHPQFLLPGRLRQQNKPKALSLVALRNEMLKDVDTIGSSVPENRPQNAVPDFGSSGHFVTRYPNVFTCGQAQNVNSCSVSSSSGVATFPTSASSFGLLTGPAHRWPQTLPNNPLL